MKSSGHLEEVSPAYLSVNMGVVVSDTASARYVLLTSNILLMPELQRKSKCIKQIVM